MPVSTDTLRDQNKLHLVFAVSAIALLASMGWLVMADYTRQWRDYQRQGRAWEAAMTIDAQTHALDAQQQRELRDLEERIQSLGATLPRDQIAEATAQLEATTRKRDRLTLPAAAVKGEIGPKTQQLERARLAGSENIAQLEEELAKLKKDYRRKASEIAKQEETIETLSDQLNKLLAAETTVQKQINDLTRTRNSLADKLKKLDPQGLAKLSDTIRNAPLLDWFNPSEKVQQVVVPDIRTDLNYLTVETIDRCSTCHVNIDNPAFEEHHLLLFAERQVASHEGQDVNSISSPVVMLSFWERAATLAGLELGTLKEHAVETINGLRSDAGLDPLESDDALADEFERIALHEQGSVEQTRAQWYRPIERYLSDVKRLLLESLEDKQFKHLRGMYRQVLIERYNEHRGENGLPSLSANPVLLGHPRLDLYVDVESPHPMKTMGCTSCHEGSGQETDFVHAAHIPQDIWVDAETGAPVPEFLLEHASGTHHAGGVATPGSAWATGWSIDGAQTVMASSTSGEHSKQTSEARSTHDDIKLTDPNDPAPFAPQQGSHAGSLSYRSISEPDRDALAVKQAEYWGHAHGWHAVHYMEWEKPMHEMRFIESSCNKCHTEVFDIAEAAPKLHEGRLLFSQMGCVNCHAVESLEDDLDIKKVGPNLAHVRQKLTAPMIASWIWSPKAFRPTTKMPHYFMLENNSSPVDILRTRTEVAAITHYLLKAEPTQGATSPYEPEPMPEDLQGDTAAGRKLFNSVGCLACHSNLDEYGEDWIVEDLVNRTGADEDQAQQQYEHMTYNQQHWYAMEHLPDKLERTGPELSGVGTKLKAGRDAASAHQQAAAWLYDWLRNPRHYSSYTIMPSFRLSEQEAADLTTYLLSLERPGYKPTDFQALDDDGKKMLAELTAQLKSAGTTLANAREEVNGTPDEPGMTTDEQLTFLGKKMIGNYGCNNCHQINGFETAASTCANLDDWGVKDPHKLDFGYFDHAFDKQREKPITVWKVDHEGVAADAPQVSHHDDKINQVTLNWETLGALGRREWLYHKLHNPRVYDRGRTAFDGHLNEDGGFDAQSSNVGKPYDKMKMPKFFLTDTQVEALVTFVTSIRKPLVTPSMQQLAVNETALQVARGKQLATRYNCYGCHNIDSNTPQIWAYFDVFNPDGSFNYDHLNNAPPRLIGQGAKTQPQWLHDFLQNVHELRPWLKVRMPSFPMSSEDATSLVAYFAAQSQKMSEHLAKDLDSIDPYRASHPDDSNWFTRSNIKKATNRLHGFALETELAKSKELDPFEATLPELAQKWAKLHKEAKFLQSMNDVTYPFTQTPQPGTDDEQWFDRGEALFNELRCYQCHALGDEEKLLALWKLDNPDVPADEVQSSDDEPEEDEEDYGYDDEEEEDYGYGDEDEQEAAPTGPVYTAPNLSYTGDRLRWDWVDRWLQEPATIQPGTKMPQWFPDGQSAFSNYPGQVKEQMHAQYGYLGADQRRVLMDFIYEAGRTGYTPGEERLQGEQPKKIELTPLPKPKIVEKQPKDSGEQSGTADTAGDDQAQSQASTPASVVAPPKPQEDATKSTIDLHDGATASHDGGGNGRVVGVVKFEGKPARRKPLRMGADAFCKKAHKKKVFDPSMVVNKDSTMRNVFIYVKSGLSGNTAVPQEPAVINQNGCMYHPHVMGVTAGQPLVILNSDNTLHNVKMNSSKNGAFNEGMPVQGMRLDKVLSKPELGINLRCDVHPWMGAYLYVVEHPFFAVSDVEGRFEITGLPPGTYTLEAIHEQKKVASMEFEVTVAADTSHRVDVTLKKD